MFSDISSKTLHDGWKSPKFRNVAAVMATSGFVRMPPNQLLFDQKFLRGRPCIDRLMDASRKTATHVCTSAQSTVLAPLLLLSDDGLQ